MTPKITIVGLGPWESGWLTGRTLAALAQGPVILRTDKHPAAQELMAQGIAFDTLDEVYDQAEDFDELNVLAARAVADAARQHGAVCYAVPGQGIAGDGTVERLLNDFKADFAFDMIPNADETAPFLARCATLHGVTATATATAPAAWLGSCRPNPKLALVVTQIDSRLTAGEVKLALSAAYGDDAPVLVGLGDDVHATTLGELDHFEGFDHRSMALLPPQAAGAARYGLYDLVDVLDTLRAPGGCPWDREQTHESLKQYLLEESYEVFEAIDRGDMGELCEELGDVLLQVVFHARLAAERGDFDIDDVADGECRKMIHRHPHIFGNVQADTADDVVKNWDAIKKKEKGQNSQAGAMQAVPAAMPAMMRAAKVQDKAKKVGFDWADVWGAYEKLEEEVRELRAEIAAGSPQERIQEEFGDVLFAAINVARFVDVHPEFALKGTVDKFVRRFEFVEREAAAQGKSLKDMTLEQMDVFWNQAKAQGL